jgi:hypothetical protein
VPSGEGPDAAWLRAVQDRRFDALPQTVGEDGLAALADRVNAFRLAQEAGLGDVQDFCAFMVAEARRTGTWAGTALELWVTLSGEHRRLRQAGSGPTAGCLDGLLDLYGALRRS